MIRRGLGIGLGLGLGVGLGLCAAPASALNNAAPPPRRGTAVVTGGSRGIGAACSRALAAKGFDVVVVYRSAAREASEVVKEITSSGGSAIAMQADVAEEVQVVRLFEKVDDWRGPSPLRVVVNNAGVLGPKGAEGGLQQLTTDSLLGVLKVNAVGPALCIREAEKRMTTSLPTSVERPGDQSGGAIVQISSGSAYIGSPLQYGCSKGALNSLTIGLVGSLAKQGIRINTISPGMTKTDMVAETLPSFDMSQIPLGRVGTPEEIANCVVWLCSDEASYVAGANVRIAGGRPPGTTLG